MSDVQRLVDLCRTYAPHTPALYAERDRLLARIEAGMALADYQLSYPNRDDQDALFRWYSTDARLREGYRALKGADDDA